MRRVGHPSLRKLHEWVEGKPVDIDRHLETCSYCADRLEPLLEETDESIRLALMRFLPLPDKLPERLHNGIDERLSNRQDLALIGEFFGLPMRTARVFTSNDQGDQ